MQINRHNYEAFFILYMDNELHTEDRRRVENFVALHPDLKEELELLQHFKLEPDTAITFSGKEELLKINGDSPVTLANYAEWFTQYTDNELTVAQRKAVEGFIAENPSTTKDLLLFQRAKLQPETIVFTDKASLYRSEKERRIVPVRWWRMAAAAILLAGIGLATYKIADNKPVADPDNSLAKSAAEKKPVTAKQHGRVETIQPAETIAPAVTKEMPVLADNNNVKVTPRVNIAKEQKTNVQNVPVTEDTPVKEGIVKVQTDNNLPKPSYNPNLINSNPSAEIVATNISPNKNVAKALTKENVTTTDRNPSDIRYASNPESDGDEIQDGKKNKLRGFFRKVTRTFEKRTNMDATTDDNKLLVAGLAINLR